MIRKIKNSAGKETGITTINDDVIIINNIGKPILELSGEIIKRITEDKNRSDEIILQLYNEYFLSIGEIASIYNVCYSNINRQLKKIEGWKPNHRGRRNRAFGHSVSCEQSQKMSITLKGRQAPIYERTPEIKQKISSSLKKYYKEHPQNPEPHKKNWANGVYDNVDFKIGIGGHFTSLKNNKTYRFRSLLELWYMIKLESDDSITNYDYEPFHILMDNGSSYAPDFLVNSKNLVELKSKKYVNRVQGVKEKVEYRQEQALKYCKEHNLTYEIIYDEDLNFDSRKMKHYINDNPNIVKKYSISFIDKSRMVIK